MSAVFDDIMDSLNELQEHAEGKPTGVAVHRRTASAGADAGSSGLCGEHGDLSVSA